MPPRKKTVTVQKEAAREYLAENWKDISAHKTENHIDLIMSYQRVFGTQEGKEVLNDMILSSNLFIANPDQTLSQFREGERNFMLRILSIIKTDLEAYKEAERQSKE